MILAAEYPDRIGRSDAMLQVERGHEYSTHAATAGRGKRTTACGRVIVFPLDLDRDTRVSCIMCRRVLRLTDAE